MAMKKFIFFLLTITSVTLILKFTDVMDFTKFRKHEEEKYFENDSKILFKAASHANESKNSSCACEKCYSASNVLLKRNLDLSIEPFLSENTKFSEEIFRWWQRLQHDRANSSYYRKTVTKLLGIFSKNPKVEKASPGRCRTCAVVGNSVNLRGSGYGTQIDSKDIIIRMNAGPIKGYEADVGTKTTHRVMYPESAVNLDNNTHLVLFAFKMQDLEWLPAALTTGFTRKTFRRINHKINANKDLVLIVSPAFMKYSQQVWMQNKGWYPSTGFMTLILALHICDEVHVFGFGADSNGNWTHYFEILRNPKYRTGPHSGSNEYEVIKKLAAEQSITFYQGS